MGTALLGPLAPKTPALPTSPLAIRSLDRTRHTCARAFRDRVMTRGGGSKRNAGRWVQAARRTGEQRRGLLSERPQNGGSIAIPPGPSEGDPGAAHPAPSWTHTA